VSENVDLSVRDLNSAGPDTHLDLRIFVPKSSTATSTATTVAVVKASERMTSQATPIWTCTICRSVAAVTTAAAKIATSRLTRNTIIGSIKKLLRPRRWARQARFNNGGLRLWWVEQ
jgi:hypothetical protein